ncbi:hypothetical protein [Candidatus Palauibacter sp.]|uniref:hypothetical protein n=1 Tax=Candidatus Palauibacter sp. TaxID=3101350 RepID=UPI003B51C3AB
MSPGIGVGPPLSDPAAEVAWRIFGVGESPLKGRSSYKLIRPIVERHVAVADRHGVIREIEACFESHGDRHWLRPEMKERMAEAVLDGIGSSNQSEAAVWAIGSINSELAISRIRSKWSAAAIDGFVHAALGSLKTACDRNRVLDPSGGFGLDLDSAGAEIPADAFVREGRIETFQNLANQGLRFVVGGLHRAVDNLIELSVALRPDLFGLVVEKLEHPVVRAKAARCAVEIARRSNHRATLDWIQADACPAQIALALVHSLETVNALDYDLRSTVREDVGARAWATELRPAHDDLDAAAESLLAGLADRLLALRSPVCVRWIGELLGAAGRSLHSHGDDKPLRVHQLETACTEALMRLVHQSWSGELLEILMAGLRNDPRATWTRHLGGLAWGLRESAPRRASEVARAALVGHEGHVEYVLEHNLPMLDWRYWDHREWIGGLGTCLAVADRTLDLREWAVDRCQQLPLSVWDADAQEDHRTFITAERLARHWFLVAFHAIPRLEELGRMVDPAGVLSLAETFLDHCRYAQPYVVGHPASSVAAELAARCAVEFGDPSERWLLDLAKHPAAGARVLWAVIDQGRRKLERAGDGGAATLLNEMFLPELASIASDRFGDGRRCRLDALEYWGRLWLALGKMDEAERAALAILAFPAKLLARGHTILSLKLLALAAGKRGLTHPIQDRLRSLYHELWSVFTPNEERLDREQVDALLKGLSHGLLPARTAR